MEFRNAIFIVTEEQSCPIYNVGEEFQVRDMALTVKSEKPACLKLVQKVAQASSSTPVFERFTQKGIKRAKFECGGCTGLIRFEFKKGKRICHPADETPCRCRTACKDKSYRGVL